MIESAGRRIGPALFTELKYHWATTRGPPLQTALYLPAYLSIFLGLVSGRGLGHHRDEGQRDAHAPERQADDELVEDGREEEADGTSELLGGRPPERERGRDCAWVVRDPAHRGIVWRRSRAARDTNCLPSVYLPPT